MEVAQPPRCLFCLSKGRERADAHQSRSQSNNEESHDAHLRSELGALKPGALLKRAKAGGVSDELAVEALVRFLSCGGRVLDFVFLADSL